MVINVRNALRSPGEAFKAEGRMEYQPLEFMGKLAFEGPVLFSGEICSNGEGVVLSGRAQAELRMNCNRCDREFIMPVNAAVSEMYYLEPAPGHERVLKDSQWLSLDEPVLKSILMEIPIRRLCSENCRGLCGICGGDLNQGECSCRRNSN